MLEDRALELLQRPARLQAQLLPQQLARLPVHRQRVSLPAGPIQREHQLPAQPLLQRVGGDQRLDLPDQLTVGSQRQIGLDPVLQRRQPRFLQPCDRSLRERLVRELGKRLSPPQPQRRAQPLLSRGPHRRRPAPAAPQRQAPRTGPRRPARARPPAGRPGPASRSHQRPAPYADARHTPARSWRRPPGPAPPTAHRPGGRPRPPRRGEAPAQPATLAAARHRAASGSPSRATSSSPSIRNSTASTPYRPASRIYHRPARRPAAPLLAAGRSRVPIRQDRP